MSDPKALIRYLPDYDRTDKREKKIYEVNTPNGHTRMEVSKFYSGSTECLIKETFYKLEDVREASPAGWNAATRFRELRSVLGDQAEDSYDSIVSDDYPNPADKTNANYEELKCALITKMSDHEYPGDEIYVYVHAEV